MQRRSGKFNHIERIIPHPEFRAKDPTAKAVLRPGSSTAGTGTTTGSYLQLNDLAIFQLSQPIYLTETVSPICLPAIKSLKYPNIIWAAGWGLTKDIGPHNLKLKYVAQRVMPPSICKKRSKWYNFEPSVFCAGGEHNQDTCQGDSGGPGISIDKGSRRYFLGGLGWFGFLKKVFLRYLLFITYSKPY